MQSQQSFLVTSILSLIVLFQSTASVRAEIPVVPEAGQASETGLSVGAQVISGAKPSTVAALVSDFRSEEISFRGAKEAGIFRDGAPAVVMVATDGGSIGSGSLISSAGQIITNWHVVEGEDQVSVVFFPTKTMPSSEDYVVLPAKVAATDETKDLALLKLGSPPPPDAKLMKLGEIGNLQIGDDTHAIGHPHSYAWTYTKGYVSSFRPTFQWVTESGIEHEADVIQTQTPINPGNSGGPLLNDNGEMIGVNSFLDGEGQALNFAVAINEVRTFLDEASNSAAAPQKCEGEILFDGRSADNTADMQEFDRNCDGVTDAWLIVPDNEDEPIKIVFDDQQDGQPNGVVSDVNRDGSWDTSIWDTTGDGKADTQGLHADGGIDPSGYRAIS